MHTISSYRGNRSTNTHTHPQTNKQTNKQTHRQGRTDYNTLHHKAQRAVY